jgi:hypothetical protein
LESRNLGPALLQAAKAGDSAAIADLLGRGADPNVRSAEGMTPLLWAARRGHAAAAARMLAEPAVDVNACDPDGYSALHEAAYFGAAALIPELVVAGCVSQGTKAGATPYDLAALNGNGAAAAVLDRLGLKERVMVRHPPWEPRQQASTQPGGVGRPASREHRAAEELAATESVALGCGSNLAGQLGLGPAAGGVVVGLRPLIIKGLASQVGAVQQISCGEDFALFLCRESDQGFGCGSNAHGQLALPRKRVAAPEPVKLEAVCGRKLASVVCGARHALWLTAAGEALGCGDNRCGQLGR